MKTMPPGWSSVTIRAASLAEVPVKPSRNNWPIFWSRLRRCSAASTVEAGADGDGATAAGEPAGMRGPSAAGEGCDSDGLGSGVALGAATGLSAVGDRGRTGCGEATSVVVL